LKDSLRGKARDDAFGRAVGEAKSYFKQCSRCGKWVCPEHCWNAKRGLCETCAPDLEEETAAAQAEAAREQVWEKARATDLVGHVNLKAEHTAAACPGCGAKAGHAKFCPDCGQSLRPAKTACGECGTEVAPGVKFCPECGNKMR
jgi:predicted amidophosphoribosyltransferase